jgi:hypothetical protein
MNGSCRWLALPLLLSFAAFAQKKPNLTGTWELTAVERDGKRLTSVKETQIFTHNEAKLTIKMLLVDPFRTEEVAITIGGAEGPIGYLTGANGTKEPVNGSARWDGDKLIFEQKFPNAKPGSPLRIIRSIHLEKNGMEMVADQVYWLVSQPTKREAKWYWAKKLDTP